MQTEPTLLWGERRRSRRRRACFPVEIHHDEGAPKTGLAREVSNHGAQILTLVPFELRTPLALMLYVDDDEASHPAIGRVVRVTEHGNDGFWSWVVTVAFDEPITALEPHVAAISERQRKAGLLD